MKAYGRMEIYLLAFLTSVLDAGRWLAAGSGCFTSRESAPYAHWIGGSVGPRASLDSVAKTVHPFPVSAGNRTPDVQPIV
jgi:hypothetical protein